ncbi:SOS response-associated peptidase [Bartonella sp. LJL80]
MCGRFSICATARLVGEAFGAWIEGEFPYRYNIAPTQPILLIRSPESYRDSRSNLPPHDMMLARWGFIPAWTKQPDSWPLTFNIRAETVSEKKSFRNALHYHRVIVPATGFYEWKKAPNAKSQPFYIHQKEGSIIGFAGLMETWSGAEGSQVDTAAILTCAAKPPLSALHRRMPVVVRRADVARWLDCRRYRPDDVMDILQRSSIEDLAYHAVSDKINNGAYLGSDVQDAILLQETEKSAGKETENKQFDLF